MEKARSEYIWLGKRIAYLPVSNAIYLLTDAGTATIAGFTPGGQEAWRTVNAL